MSIESRGVNRAARPSGLADVLDVILDKGIVIDAYVRVAVVGIELLTIDARIVVASVDTYLRFAEAVNRLELQPNEQVGGLPGMIEKATEGGSAQKTKGALSGAKESVKDGAKEVLESITPDDEGDSGRQAAEGREAPESRRARRRGEENT